MGKAILYFIISLSATTAGALTGIGGGVIIKPVLDILKDYNVETISLLSSITVLTMSLVSVAKHVQQKTQINFTIALPLALGSIAGGFIGQRLLKSIVNLLNLDRLILVIQNFLLAALIFVVFFYMLNKNKIKSHHYEGTTSCLIIGVFLGIISSFLGIGGGPINVAIFIYLFSFDMKTAAVSSLITILFAQISKLLTVACTSGFAGFDLSMLPAMMIGGIAGGMIGSMLNKKLPKETVEKGFNAVQGLILFIAIFNILKNIS